MTHATILRRALVSVMLSAASGACSTSPARPPQSAGAAEWVIAAVAPSIVEVSQDDRASSDGIVADAEASLADESRAPKKVVKIRGREGSAVSSTGFVIEGGIVVTAAHVLVRADRVRITTQDGRTVDGRVTHVDELRDLAIVQPKKPLDGIPALSLSDVEPRVGQLLWTMTASGHGAVGAMASAAAGIAWGVADFLGARTLFFGAITSREFGGAPVIALDADDRPTVVGAIRKFPRGDSSSPSMSAAITVKELRAVMAGRPHPLQRVLEDFAHDQRSRTYADLFVTSRLALGRDASGEQVAWLDGIAPALASVHSPTTLSCMAILFGLPAGEETISFELRDPGDQVVSAVPRLVHIDDARRAALASVTFQFEPKTHGRFFVVARRDGNELGRTSTMLGLDDDDDELVEIGDGDPVQDGVPDVDVVVTMPKGEGDEQASEVRTAWSLPSVPRRVGFSWYARGTRGWSIRGAEMTAYVLDSTGTVVGRADGCTHLEATPQQPWSCWGRNGTEAFARAEHEGLYDIVFAVGDRPVAWWPMASVVTTDAAPGSDVDRWVRELQRTESAHRQKHPSAPNQPPVTAPKDSAPPQVHPQTPAPSPPAATPQKESNPEGTRHSR
jgi:hypothetical protein